MLWRHYMDIVLLQPKIITVMANIHTSCFSFIPAREEIKNFSHYKKTLGDRKTQKTENPILNPRVIKMPIRKANI